MHINPQKPCSLGINALQVFFTILICCCIIMIWGAGLEQWAVVLGGNTKFPLLLCVKLCCQRLLSVSRSIYTNFGCVVGSVVWTISWSEWDGKREKIWFCRFPWKATPTENVLENILTNITYIFICWLAYVFSRYQDNCHVPWWMTGVGYMFRALADCDARQFLFLVEAMLLG